MWQCGNPTWCMVAALRLGNGMRVPPCSTAVRRLGDGVVALPCRSAVARQRNGAAIPHRCSVTAWRQDGGAAIAPRRSRQCGGSATALWPPPYSWRCGGSTTTWWPPSVLCVDAAASERRNSPPSRRSAVGRRSVGGTQSPTHCKFARTMTTVFVQTPCFWDSWTNRAIQPASYGSCKTLMTRNNSNCKRFCLLSAQALKKSYMYVLMLPVLSSNLANTHQS